MRSVYALVVLLSSAAVAHADGFGGGDEDEYTPPPSSTYQEIGITEKLSAQVPLDLPFRDETGRAVSLRDYFRDDLPVVLTFNYSNCPMLCSLQLNGLAKALGQIDLAPGSQFRIVTIDIDPLESPTKLAAMRQSYLARLPAARRAAAERGWTFLVARVPAVDTQIRAVADAVGFRYKYIAERGEYAHPAGLILVSSRGTVTRYLGGTDYAPDVLRESIVRAGLAETSTSAGFFLTCFHDVGSTARSRGVLAIVRVVVFAFLIFAGGAFVLSRRKGRRRWR